MATKQRLDVLLTEKGLADSRSKAQSLILAGKVTVDGQVALKPSLHLVDDSAEIDIKAEESYVGRGALKLVAALDAFEVNPSQYICADVGASTGGFTDVLLRNNAKQVYAIDVGYGQLAWSLRQNERVTVMERTNVRYLYKLPDTIDLCVIDVSFISIDLILPVVIKWLKVNGKIVSLIKPQFEAERRQVGKKGIIRDNTVHKQVLEKVVSTAKNLDLAIKGLIPSPITGANGNYEFLIYLERQTTHQAEIDINQAIESCIASIQHQNTVK